MTGRDFCPVWLGRGWWGQFLTVVKAAAQLKHMRSSAILYSRLRGTEPDDVTLFLVPAISSLIGGASNMCSEQSNWSMPRNSIVRGFPWGGQRTIQCGNVEVRRYVELSSGIGLREDLSTGFSRKMSNQEFSLGRRSESEFFSQYIIC
jgi:hypothetical protein